MCEKIKGKLGKSIAILKTTKRWINRYKNNYSVYYGIDANGEEIYVGITKQDLDRILAQHKFWGKPFENLDEIADELTRNQARCLEQYIITSRPDFINKINSINPKRDIYNKAKQIGKMLYNWLNLRGK